jgi:hypothetical protein
MSSIDKPKPIDQALQGRRLSIGPEQVAALDEEHLLGLDKPMNEIIGHGQSLLVSDVVRLISEVGSSDNQRDVYEAILERFGLNSGTYDEETNPQGLFKKIDIRNTAKITTIRGALLRLTGVHAEEIKSFFGISQHSQVILRTSPGYSAAVADTDHKRETFALRHPERFPQIHETLVKIGEVTGLTPEELFTPGFVPPVFVQKSHLHGGRKIEPNIILLEEVMAIINEALSGTMSASDIINAHSKQNRSPYIIKDILTGAGGNRKTLSEPLIKIIEKRLNTKE